MKTRVYGIRLLGIISGLTLALTLAGPPAQASGSTVVVDTSNPATNCGSYTSHTAVLSLATALTGLTGGTVVICPGDYLASGNALSNSVTGSLTIKQAVPGLENRPHLVVQGTTHYGIQVIGPATFTIDGLYIDGTQDTNIGFTPIMFVEASGTVRNSILQGNDQNAVGLSMDNSGTTQFKVTLSNSVVAGYGIGVKVSGPMKLTMTGTTLDGTDGGRVTASSQKGVFFNGPWWVPNTLTGSISKNTIMNNFEGILIEDTTKVSVASNTLINNTIGVHVEASTASADGTKITGNTILAVPDAGYGIWLDDNGGAPAATMHSTVISKNKISSGTFNSIGSTTSGIALYQFDTTPGRIAAAISANTLLGFVIVPSPRYIYYISAGATVTGTGNVHVP